LYAIAAPITKPRASIPTTASIPFAKWRCAIRSIARWKDDGSDRSVVMSLNWIPFFGKSGMLRIRFFRSLVA